MIKNLILITATFIFLGFFVRTNIQAQDIQGGKWYIDSLLFNYGDGDKSMYSSLANDNLTDLTQAYFCFENDSIVKGSNIFGNYIEQNYLLTEDSLKFGESPTNLIEWNGENEFITSFFGKGLDEMGNLVDGTLFTSFLRDTIDCNCSEIHVTSTSPENVEGSLKYLINNACDDVFIRFDTLTDESPIIFDSVDDEILLTKNIRIKGNGISKTILDGNNISRIFKITANSRLWLYDLTLRNAIAANDGGAILNEGLLILENVILENNYEGLNEKSLTNKNMGEVVIYPSTSTHIK